MDRAAATRDALADDWLRARDVVAEARERLEREPLLFLHGADAGCAECDDARRSVTG